jgi:hypothetical protein
MILKFRNCHVPSSLMPSTITYTGDWSKLWASRCRFSTSVNFKNDIAHYQVGSEMKCFKNCFDFSIQWVGYANCSDASQPWTDPPLRPCLLVRFFHPLVVWGWEGIWWIPPRHPIPNFPQISPHIPQFSVTWFLGWEGMGGVWDMVIKRKLYTHSIIMNIVCQVKMQSLQ